MVTGLIYGVKISVESIVRKNCSNKEKIIYF